MSVVTHLVLRKVYIVDGPQRPLGRRLRPQKIRDGEVDVLDGAPRCGGRRLKSFYYNILITIITLLYIINLP